MMTDSEKFPLVHEEEGNPYIFRRPSNSIQECVVQELSDIRSIFQRGAVGRVEGRRDLAVAVEEAFAKGTVDLKGKPTLVEYGFNAQSKKITVSNGCWVWTATATAASTSTTFS